MFGIYRTILAFIVIVGHLFGPFPIGNYAVFGFYVLSGYLMTHVMDRSYGFNAEGKKRFMMNRLLRIFPNYYFAIFLSVFLLVCYQDRITNFPSVLYLPNTYQEWFRNLFLIFSIKSQPRLSPPTWALSVEIFFYFCICLGFSKTKRRTNLWVALSVIMTGVILLTKESWHERYYTLQASSLPFSIGAWVFHYKNALSGYLQRLRLNRPVFWVSAMLLNMMLWFMIEKVYDIEIFFSYGFYINLILVSGCLVSLISYESSIISIKADNYIGKYSYPMYLIHWQSAAIINLLSGNFYGQKLMSFNGLVYLVISLLLTLAISSFMVHYIDIPIEKVRRRIKGE